MANEKVELNAVARGLAEAQVPLFNSDSFTVVSGNRTGFYLDFGNVRSYPQSLRTIIDLYERLLKQLPYKPDRLMDIPSKATPFVGCLSLEVGIGQITPNFNFGMKQYGAPKPFIGTWEDGMRVVAVDDLLNYGTSLKKGVRFARDQKLIVTDALTAVDRQNGGKKALLELEDGPCTVHTGFDITDIARVWNKEGLITPDQFSTMAKELTDLNGN